MPIRVAINGFGRIGRNVLRAAKKAGATDIDFVAVNDLTDTKTLAHLLKYDSVHGIYAGTVEAREQSLVVDGDEMQGVRREGPRRASLGATWAWTSSSSPPAASPTRPTPRSTSRAARRRSSSPPRPRTRTSPSSWASTRTSTTPANHHVVSNASCTTNCLAPVVKVLLDEFGFRARADDHRPRLHQRPEHPGPAPQGPAPGPRRRHVHHPHHHGRRQGHRRW